jgi:hypothetical protein
MVNQDEWELHQEHFSRARLTPYLEACRGETERAIKLYEWNARAASTMWESIMHIEVALRNAINARLEARGTARGARSHWIFDERGELGRSFTTNAPHERPYLEVNRTLEQLVADGKTPTPGKIISELNFGFWCQLVSRRQTRLWPDLAAAFPYAPTRARQDVALPVNELRQLRNRIGHHHKIFHLDLERHEEQVFLLSGYISPHLREWMVRRSTLQTLLDAKPLP